MTKRTHTSVSVGHKSFQKAFDKNSSEIFSRLFFNSPAMMVITDAASGVVLEMNKQFEKFYGYKKKEVIGKTLKQVNAYVNPDDRDKIASFVMKKKLGKNFELKERTKKGDIRWVSASVQLITIHGRKCFLGSGVDITDRKKAESELKILNAELEKKVAERTRELELANQKLTGKVQDLNTFVYKASHDLKGPLSSVSGLVNLAEISLQEDAKATEFITRIKESNNKLDGILNNLLAVTRITQGKNVTGSVDVADLLDDVVGSLSVYPGRDSVKIRSDIRMKKNYVGDITVLTSILQNLIQNSISYRRHDTDSFVNVSVFPEAKNVIIEVTDNGKGIPPELQKKVFEMFFRGDESSKGSGLGLYIVSASVDKINGTIDLKSTVGKGTTIRVILPQ